METIRMLTTLMSTLGFTAVPHLGGKHLKSMDHSFHGGHFQPEEPVFLALYGC